jgi:hypothetical protein
VPAGNGLVFDGDEKAVRAPSWPGSKLERDGFVLNREGIPESVWF